MWPCRRSTRPNSQRSFGGDMHQPRAFKIRVHTSRFSGQSRESAISLAACLNGARSSSWVRVLCQQSKKAKESIKREEIQKAMLT